MQLAVSCAIRNRNDLISALCNDGSVWVIVWGEQPGGEHWERLVDIPQDD